MYSKSRMSRLKGVLTLAILLSAALPHAASAAAVLRSTYSATVSPSVTGTTNAAIGPDGTIYTVGTNSNGVISRTSADGTVTSDITPDIVFPSVSGRSVTASGNNLYIVGNGAVNRVYRMQTSGSTAVFISSGSLTAGASAITRTTQGSLYVSKSTTLYRINPTDTSVLSTVTIGSTPISMVPDAAGTYLYYTTSAGQLRRTDPAVGTSTETALVTGLGQGTKIATDAGGYLYVVTKAGSLRKYTSTGVLLWSMSTGYSSRYGTGGLMVQNGIIYTVDNSTKAINTYYPINAVSAFSATASGSAMQLQWTNAVTDTDFSGVTIRRSTSGYPATATDGSSVTLNDTGNSYSDAGLADGTYYYSIFNRTLGGEYGAALTASGTVSAPPAAPIISGAVTGSRIDLNWTVPSGTHSFILRRTVDTGAAPASISDGTAVAPELDASVSSYAQTALADGTYYYSVFAKNADGNPSGPGSTAALTVDTTAPSAPSVSAVADGDDVRLSWDVPSGTDSFVVRWGAVSAPATASDGSSLGTPASSVTSLTHAGLANGTYYYSVFAVDAYGNVSNAGTASATVTVVASSSSQGTTDARTARGGGGGGGGRGVARAAERLAGRASAAQHAAAPASAVGGHETMAATLKLRTCQRVAKSYSSSPGVLKRVNARLQKRFGFGC